MYTIQYGEEVQKEVGEIFAYHGDVQLGDSRDSGIDSEAFFSVMCRGEMMSRDDVFNVSDSFVSECFGRDSQSGICG